LKSSTGKYFIALDHIRALAVFIVFTWHFIHVNDGQYAPPPIFPLSLLTEGHTGVSLFMVLSGYLFAKLLDGKKIIYTQFIWNRFLRLAPLLTIVKFIVGIQMHFSGDDVSAYIRNIILGIILPSLPNGGWSITVEFHFYLFLPILLFLAAKWKKSLLFVLAFAIIVRTLLHQELGQIQVLSYLTFIGRIDQFVFGIAAHQFGKTVEGKHLQAAGVLFLFTCFYWYFDLQGGFFKSSSFPSPSMIWVFMPAIEGLAYATLIAWYDHSFTHSTGRVSRFIALIGTYSYSIYLLHFFIVFKMANFVNDHIFELSNIYWAIFFSAICFLLMIPIGYLSYQLVESPFLRFRTNYIVLPVSASNSAIDVG